MTYWLSSRALTVAVQVGPDGRITVAPPVVRRFVGQPVSNLVAWMTRQGGLFVERRP